MHRVTTNDFKEDHEVTVGVEFGTLLVKIEEQTLKLQIWDTAGQESFKSITKIFYRGAHCVVLAYDITRLETFENLRNWIDEVMAQSEPEVIVILIGNMKDREHKREVSIEKAEAFRARHNIPFFVETSAKTGENVETIFTMASKLLYHNFKDRIASMKE
jgi:Ras-related protein Rab-2A